MAGELPRCPRMRPCHFSIRRHSVTCPRRYVPRRRSTSRLGSSRARLVSSTRSPISPLSPRRGGGPRRAPSSTSLNATGLARVTWADGNGPRDHATVASIMRTCTHARLHRAPAFPNRHARMHTCTHAHLHLCTGRPACQSRRTWRHRLASVHRDRANAATPLVRPGAAGLDLRGASFDRPGESAPRTHALQRPSCALCLL